MQIILKKNIENLLKNNTRYNRYKNENKQHRNKKLNKYQHKQKNIFLTLLFITMKHFTIIYWKKRNYKWIEFMEYNLIEKWTNENLMINWYDFMRIWETKKRTIEVYNNRLETQKKKLEEKEYNYRDVIHELNYCIENKHLHINH